MLATALESCFLESCQSFPRFEVALRGRKRLHVLNVASRSVLLRCVRPGNRRIWSKHARVSVLVVEVDRNRPRLQLSEDFRIVILNVLVVPMRVH